MGEPKFSRPKFDTPPHPWKKARIEEEHLIQANHGLKNMREIWKAKSQLRRHRRQAMRLIGTLDTSEGHGMREKDDLLRSLHLKGFISKDAILDDILSLNAETILNRRLQAMVYYKGLACTLKQARQLVTHGHICIGDQKVSIPSYPVNRDEEDITLLIAIFGTSAIIARRSAFTCAASVPSIRILILFPFGHPSTILAFISIPPNQTRRPRRPPFFFVPS